MLNTRKLLYILSDVVYVAELLPTKKEHTFAIQSFRQINGDFINEDTFIVENIQKLFKKIDTDEYHLVLPDFLFTNTIVEIGETSDAKVKSHLKETLLPQLSLSKETHLIKTFVATQHGDKSKVQISAIEKELLASIVHSAAENNIRISDISSLSWTIKSVVSLEPSISVVQIGNKLYLAQHYIGLDQATITDVAEQEAVGETIKTLKGAEPSIQTVYLITNELVEEKLRDQLADTLPLQQLASFKEDDTQMPSYVKYVIEAGMKTLSIDEYHVPLFALPKPTEVAQPESTPTTDEVEEQTPDELPTPTPLETSAEPPEPIDTNPLEETSVPSPTIAPVATPTQAAMVSSQIIDLDLNDAEDNTSEEVTPEPTSEPESTTPSSSESDASEDDSELDLSAFETLTEPTPATPTTQQLPEAKTETQTVSALEAVTTTTTTAITKPTPSPTPSHTIPHTPPARPIIKNKSGVGSMVKMILIAVVVFAATVGVGVGLGLGFLSFTQENNNQAPASPTPVASPATQASPSPSPVTSPSPSPLSAEEIGKYKILIVNATTISGHAGKTKKALETAGFKNVIASNAKGTYEKGTYVLMKTEDAGLVSLLEKSSSLELTFSDKISVEDPKGQYDAVIVLAE